MQYCAAPRLLAAWRILFAEEGLADLEAVVHLAEDVGGTHP
jgi:hypothetical protein